MMRSLPFYTSGPRTIDDSVYRSACHSSTTGITSIAVVISGIYGYERGQDEEAHIKAGGVSTTKRSDTLSQLFGQTALQV